MIVVVAMLFAQIGNGAATAQTRDVVVEVPKHETREDTGSSNIFNVGPVVNPLRAPNVSRIKADTSAGPNAKGVMTPHGAESATRAFGSFGIPYTTTRVQEGPSVNAATPTSENRLSTTFPYNTVGKLTFSQGYCSASIILRGVIVTAAHCIQSFGSGGNIFTRYRFTPGHYGARGATADQKAPYGTWRRQGLVRPRTWANGRDIGCGAARDNDLAVIAIKPQNGMHIGDVVGAMSYGWNNYSFVTSRKTGRLHTAAVSTLGYPFLMDRGKIMQRTDGPTYTTTVCSAGQLWQGSNLTGGSSGGPFVVNFAGQNAALSGGARKGKKSRMAVIGVTSWGSSDPNTPKDNYSSQFRQNTAYPDADYGGYGGGNIGALINTLCSSTVPNTTDTYAALGYCD